MVESDRVTNGTGASRGARGKLRAVGVAVGLTILAVLLSAVVGAAVAVPLFAIGLSFESAVTFLTLLLGGQVGLFAAGYLYVRRYDLPVRIARPGRRELSYALAGTIAALAVALGAGALMERLGLTPESVLEEFVATEPVVLLWLAVLSIFVVAPAEEYLFRGVVQGRLRRSFGPAGAILAASLLFGSLHFGNWVGPPGTLVGLALLISTVGVVMGVLYERTGNLAVPIVAHGAYNFVLFTAGFLTI